LICGSETIYIYIFVCVSLTLRVHL